MYVTILDNEIHGHGKTAADALEEAKDGWRHAAAALHSPSASGIIMLNISESDTIECSDNLANELHYSYEVPFKISDEGIAITLHEWDALEIPVPVHVWDYLNKRNKEMQDALEQLNQYFPKAHND